jgi:ribosome biogenesis GTPase
VAVGDRVRISREPTGEGVIEEVEPRKAGKLSRSAAGTRRGEQVVAVNVDQLIAVASVELPPLNRRLLDRIIVSGEHDELNIVVCVNKIDLGDRDDIEPMLDVYRSIGYSTLITSAATGEGIEELRATLRDKTSVLAGASGVGKSSLLNCVEPGLDLRVQTVSESTQKGRHTTTSVSLIPLACGGYMVDTPGIREFGLFDIHRDVLQHHFPEIGGRFHDCRFADCEHLHEPGCAVIAAVEAGEIDRERYESYCRIIETLPVAGDYRNRPNSP